MGDYNAIATRFKVKKTAPAELISFLDQFYTRVEESESRALAAPNKTIEAMVDMLYRVCGVSAYHEAWHWRVKEDCGDYWVYESRSSTKHSPIKEFKALVEGISEYLVIEAGDIFFIDIWEDGKTEDILFWNGNEVIEREGWVYKSDEYGYITDSDHPRREKLSKEDKAIENDRKFDSYKRYDYGSHLIWTIGELDEAIAKKARREERKRKLEMARRYKYPSYG